MNFWTALETQQITSREQIEQTLIKKLGSPANQIQTNLLFELTKKINSYYQAHENHNHTVHSLFGCVAEISERPRKAGKRKGQIAYNLKLTSKEILKAYRENLPEDKWTQITKLAILGKDLVFKYKKWITNKEVLDFYPQAKK
jgi:hypothetical protein